MRTLPWNPENLQWILESPRGMMGKRAVVTSRFSSDAELIKVVDTIEDAGATRMSHGLWRSKTFDKSAICCAGIMRNGMTRLV